MTLATPHGTFTIRGGSVGVSLYRAGRPLRANYQRVEPGQIFPVMHRTGRTLARLQPPHLYGGDYLGTWDLSGKEVRRA